MIEQEVKNVKVEDEDISVADTSIIEESKEVKKEVEEIDFDKMELGE
jgi:predicted RNA-binding protein